MRVWRKENSCSEQRYSSIYKSPPLSSWRKIFCFWRTCRTGPHVASAIGWNDPLFHTSMALIHVCNSDKALSFDHGKGHEIPCGLRAAQRISLDIQELIKLSKKDSSWWYVRIKWTQSLPKQKQSLLQSSPSDQKARRRQLFCPWNVKIQDEW